MGAAVAIGNFAGICFVVQKIIDEPDEKKRKATLQLSYNSRMLLQAVWVVVAIAAPCFQPFAGVLPLFFPRITIYYLQITGKYSRLRPRRSRWTSLWRTTPPLPRRRRMEPVTKGVKPNKWN